MRIIKFFALLLIALAVSRSASAAERPKITAVYIQYSPVIDGNSADWNNIKKRKAGICFFKGDGQSGSVEKYGTTVCGTIDDINDCCVSLWLAHDANYLYVLAEVTDDFWEPLAAADQNNPAYREDALHLYIDSNNACTADIQSPPITSQPGYEQFGISTDNNIFGENTDFTNEGKPKQPAPKNSKPDGIYWLAKCGVYKLNSGYKYIFEERIKLAAWPGRNMFPLSPGKSYGFNAEFCDADNGKELQGFIFWSSDGKKDAWNHQNLWGILSLEKTD
jgi:hypothetical protein